jgi:hypothetical protein
MIAVEVNREPMRPRYLRFGLGHRDFRGHVLRRGRLTKVPG